MRQDIKEQLNEITRLIAQAALAHEIILFGSYAYGNPNKDSDIDLCIVIEKQDKRKTDLIKLIRRNISSIASIPVDILLYYADEFYERAEISSTLESKIKREGIKVYG